jgi:putative transferase (TIGR04331 family)
LWYDDPVKAYASQKIEDGSVLVYGQHGGGYGTAKLNVDEEHEVCIADRYLSMGWVNNQNPKIIPMSHFRFRKKWPGPFNKKNDLLLVTLDASRYSFRGCTESALDMKKYLRDAFLCVDSLSAVAQRSVVVRLAQNEKGWFHASRWQDRFPKIIIEHGSQDIYRLMKNSRMVISTYNQTTILETLAFNIPSVLFCDLQQTPLRDTAVPFYAQLKQVGIFHDTPESAAKHINEVWNDVDSWWFSESVQNAVTEFTHHYCRRVSSIVPKIRTVFKETIRKQRSIAA